jgi:hypothetical protein
MEEARELLLKHLYLQGGDGLGISDGRVYNACLNAIMEALTIPAVSNWVAVKDSMPENCDQVFVKYENGKYGINEWWESDNCWKYAFDNMIVKEWCKPPCY